MRRWLVGLSAVVGMTMLVVACSVGSDCDFGLCAGPPAGGDTGTGDAGDGAVPDAQPPGCDPTKDQKDQPACQNSDFAIFVAPTGTPGGAGTQQDPVNTVTKALTLIAGKKQRIFVCEGAYPERITLTAAVSIYGGLACGATPWPAGGRAVIGKVGEAGYALDAVNVGGTFEISDLELVAGDGTEAFPNSIAARFVGTGGATLKRVKLTAKNGFAGKTGDVGVEGSTVKHTDMAGAANYDPKGNGADVAGSGQPRTCKCPNVPAVTTVGGPGGSAGGGGGGQGTDILTPSPTLTEDGLGGAGGGSCANGHTGAAREQGTGGAVPTRLGALDSNGWKSEPGGTGLVGLPGQGGGGGGGVTGGGGGGGGACGGCGGFGGKGGVGGGASIALLAVDSALRFSGELATGTGGRGGDGGDGGDGAGSAFGGNGFNGGCNGGKGGPGGKGGGGSGGSGGLSVGILSKGTPPNSSGTAFILGDRGLGGTGKGLATNNGPDGIKANTASVETILDGGM